MERQAALGWWKESGPGWSSGQCRARAGRRVAAARQARRGPGASNTELFAALCSTTSSAPCRKRLLCGQLGLVSSNVRPVGGANVAPAQRLTVSRQAAAAPALNWPWTLRRLTLHLSPSVSSISAETRSSFSSSLALSPRLLCVHLAPSCLSAAVAHDVISARSERVDAATAVDRARLPSSNARSPSP